MDYRAVSLSTSLCWNLSHNMMVFGSETSEMLLGQEDGALMNEISALIKRNPQEHLGGTVGQAADSWFPLRSWPQGPDLRVMWSSPMFTMESAWDSVSLSLCLSLLCTSSLSLSNNLKEKKRGLHRALLLSSYCVKIQEKKGIYKPGSGLSKDIKSTSILIFEFPASRTVRNKSLSFKLPSLWYFFTEDPND